MLIHAVLRAVVILTTAGFRGVPETLRMSRRNCGLSGIRCSARIPTPAASAPILTGLPVESVILRAAEATTAGRQETSR